MHNKNGGESAKSEQKVAPDSKLEKSTTVETTTQPNSTLPPKPKRRGSGVDEGNIKELNNTRKRFKIQSRGIIMVGGHFEKKIDAYSRQFQKQWGLAEQKIVACGIRVFIDNILSLIPKFEKKIEDSTVERPQILFNRSEKLIALVVFKNKKSLFHTYSNSLPSILNWLRHNGIKSTSYIHRLICDQAVSIVEEPLQLCKKLDIPILIVLEHDEDLDELSVYVSPSTIFNMYDSYLISHIIVHK